MEINQLRCLWYYCHWVDNNPAVYIASNSYPQQSTRLVCSWNKIDQMYIQVPLPNQFHCYIQDMFFVGQMVQNVAKYHIAISMKKWWWAPFAWMLDVSAQTAWIPHWISHTEDPSCSLLSFRRDIVNTIFLKYCLNGAINNEWSGFQSGMLLTMFNRTK